MRRYLLIIGLIIFFIRVSNADVKEVMGDWVGAFSTEMGDTGTLMAQVIALGNDSCQVVIQIGEGDAKLALVGQMQAGKIAFDTKVNLGSELGGEYRVKGELSPENFSGTFEGLENSGTFQLQKVKKSSPTIGKQPPEGAIVLFDGKSLAGWKQLPIKKKDKIIEGEGPAKWKILEDGAMEVTKGNITPLKTWGDHLLHIEFRIPFMPEQHGQKRGNSGVYVHGRYEVQVLDSYGREPKDNLCGGIYKKATPLVNACLPPLEWQTYDITFYASKFNESGEKIQNAVISVEHNGVVIHDRVELDGPTPGGITDDEKAPGGLMLQDHNDPVQYRNIWVLPLESSEEK